MVTTASLLNTYASNTWLGGPFKVTTASHVFECATAHGGALCCEATLVSPLTRTGHPQPCTAEVDGAVLQVAECRKREAGRRNCPCSVARSEARNASSATWCASALSARPLPCELPRRQAGRGAGGEHFPLRSSSPSLGRPWPAAPQPGPSEGPSLNRVLDLAAPEVACTRKATSRGPFARALIEVTGRCHIRCTLPQRSLLSPEYS